MSKLKTRDNSEAEEKLTELVKHNPEQIEKEIFADIDAEGVNQNPSAQQEYPGIQRHEEKPSQS